MTLEQFQEEAPKTLNDLTVEITDFVPEEFQNNILEAGRRANIGHMAMGMAGETLSELLLADYKQDKNNILEEAADIAWYVVIVAMWKGIKLNTIRLTYHDITNPDYIHLSESTGLTVNLTVGTLVDVLKRESCYGEAKYQKKEVTNEVWENLIYDVMKALVNFLKNWELNPEDGYDKVIKKLHKVRYKDGYSDAAALNRDTDAEERVINT